MVGVEGSAGGPEWNGGVVGCVCAGVVVGAGGWVFWWWGGGADTCIRTCVTKCAAMGRQLVTAYAVRHLSTTSVLLFFCVVFIPTLIQGNREKAIDSIVL